MRSYEHRAIGDEATGAARVNVGGDGTDERFDLTFGDVVALSGDYFRPGFAQDVCSFRRDDAPRRLLAASPRRKRERADPVRGDATQRPGD